MAWQKIVLWILAAVGVLLLLGLLALHAVAFSFTSPDYTVNDYFSKLNVDHRIHRTQFKEYTIRHIESGLRHDSATLLFFIHGAPGNWDAFKQFLADYDLNQEFRMVSIDRIGYGLSERGQAVTDIVEQADAAQHILDTYGNTEKYIVSHSYGGPISAVMAARDSTIDGLIMCAPVNDPETEPELWYADLANTSLMRFLMPSFIDVAAKEKKYHPTELKKILPYWPDVTCPILHYHGTDDRLAPYDANVAFSKQHFTDQQLTLVTQPGGGHLLIWFKAATFKNLIIEFINSNSHDT